MRLYSFIATLVISSMTIPGISRAQGEFVPQGENGVGASFGAAFTKGGSEVSTSLGASIDGLVDIGAGAVSSNSNNGSSSSANVAPYVAYHTSKQTDSTNQFETILLLAYYLGREKHLNFEFI